MSTGVDQTHYNPASTQDTSQHVLTTPPNESEDTQRISTCIDQTHPMPARTQNASQLVLTKHLPCQRGHEIHISMC